MLKNKLKNLALAVLLALSGMGQAYAAQEFLPVSDVQEGMHGYAKTVVHGRQIDTFDVEVLGILKHKGASGGASFFLQEIPFRFQYILLP